MFNSNFSKFLFHPKITLFVLLKVKLPNMTDWHKSPRNGCHLLGFQESVRLGSAQQNDRNPETIWNKRKNTGLDQRVFIKKTTKSCDKRQ